MYKNILLAYDGSDLDQKALIECKDLTNWPSAQITLLTVSPNFYTSIGMEAVSYTHLTLPTIYSV